jgi:maleate cis-trans isomerase
MIQMTDEDLKKFESTCYDCPTNAKDATIEVFGYGRNSLIVAGIVIVGVYYAYSKGMFKKIKI